MYKTFDEFSPKLKLEFNTKPGPFAIGDSCLSPLALKLHSIIKRTRERLGNDPPFFGKKIWKQRNVQLFQLKSSLNKSDAELVIIIQAQCLEGTQSIFCSFLDTYLDDLDDVLRKLKSSELGYVDPYNSVFYERDLYSKKIGDRKKQLNENEKLKEQINQMEYTHEALLKEKAAADKEYKFQKGRNNEYKAEISIQDLALLKGKLPPRVLGLVMERASQHQEELLFDWKLAEKLQPLKPIQPLE